MKAPHDPALVQPEGFTGDLCSRLELVRQRVDSEWKHLDEVATVAASYAAPLPPPLKLVR